MHKLKKIHHSLAEIYPKLKTILTIKNLKTSVLVLIVGPIIESLNLTRLDHVSEHYSHDYL